MSERLYGRKAWKQTLKGSPSVSDDLGWEWVDTEKGLVPKFWKWSLRAPNKSTHTIGLIVYLMRHSRSTLDIGLCCYVPYNTVCVSVSLTVGSKECKCEWKTCLITWSLLKCIYVAIITHILIKSSQPFCLLWQPKCDDVWWPTIGNHL